MHHFGVCCVASAFSRRSCGLHPTRAADVRRWLQVQNAAFYEEELTAQPRRQLSVETSSSPLPSPSKGRSICVALGALASLFGPRASPRLCLLADRWSYLGTICLNQGRHFCGSDNLLLNHSGRPPGPLWQSR